jgi:hypothetical protein
MIKINWYPTVQNILGSNITHQEVNIVYIPPEPAYKYFLEKYANARYVLCPAFSDYLKNTFIIRSPYDFVVTLNREQGSISIDRHGQDFFNNNIKMTYIEGSFVLQLPPRMIFIPENNESVMVTSLPLMLDPNPLSIIPGTFDISKWVRPIEIAIQVHNEEKIVFKRGDPLMMLKFTSSNNDSIQLEQKIIDENVIALTSACVRVKNTNPSLNLKTLYKMANFYVLKMRKTIFENDKQKEQEK